MTGSALARPYLYSDLYSDDRFDHQSADSQPGFARLDSGADSFALPAANFSDPHAELTNPQSFQDLLNFLENAFGQTNDLADLAGAVTRLVGTIVTVNDGVTLLTDLQGFFDTLDEGTGDISDALDMVSRIDKISHATNPAEETFAQIADILAEAGIVTTVKWLTFSSLTFETGMVPFAEFVADVAGLAAKHIYNDDISADIQAAAREFYEAYLGNHSLSTDVSDIYIGKKGGDNGSYSLPYNVIAGGAGDDDLSGGSGSNTLLGGTGNDTFHDNGTASKIDGGAGADYLYMDRSALAASVVINFVDSAKGIVQSVHGTTVVNVEETNLSTGSGNDAVTFDIVDYQTQYWNAGTGSDTATVDLSAHGDQFHDFYSGGSYILAYSTPNGGGNFLYLTGVENFVFTGGSNNDYFAAADMLNGSAAPGNDVFSGGGGNDQLYGGGGKNTLLGGDGDDILQDNGTGSTIDGGTGVDYLTLSRQSLSSAVTLDFVQSAKGVIQTLADGTTIVNVEHVNLVTGSGNDTVAFDMSDFSTQYWNAGTGTDTAIVDLSALNAGFNDFYSGGQYVIGYSNGHVSGSLLYLNGVENFDFTGGAGNDFFAGTDYLNGAATPGNDVFAGGAGNDQLYGGGGRNALYGGDGDDFLQDSGSGATIDGGTGTDYLTLVRSSLSANVTLNLVQSAKGVVQTLSDGTTIVNVEQVGLSTGTGNDTVTFDMNNFNAQSWDAGTGSDTAVVNLAPLNATFSDYYSSGQYHLYYSTSGSNGTILTLTGVENFDFTGGAGDDAFYGTDVANGAAAPGDDIFSGGAGNDTLDGGGGKNTLLGGDGDDYLQDTGSGGTIDGGTGIDYLTLDRSGLDSRVILNFVQLASGHAEHLSDGTTLNNIELVQLSTGSGSDTVTFDAANFTQQSWDAGAGTDTAVIDLSSLNATFYDNYSSGRYYIEYSGPSGSGQLLTLTGVENFNFTGGAGDDTFYGTDVLNGSAPAGNDVFSGGAGNDTLYGGGGDDILTGNSGADYINSGTGRDVIVYLGVSDSTSTGFDTIAGFDMLYDKFDMPTAVTGIDTAVKHGSLSLGSFDADLATIINASHLGAGHAVLYTPDAGSFAGDTFLIIDGNGTAGYQAGQDYVLLLSGTLHLTSLATGDFI